MYNRLNYMLFEEFKRLDKLCGDLYQEQHGISRYIDDMKNTSTGPVISILQGQEPSGQAKTVVFSIPILSNDSLIQ